MAAACDIQTILTANPCLATLFANQLEIYKVGVLCSIVDKLQGGPGIDCSDPQTVFDENPCLFELFPNQLKIVEAALVCQINTLLA